VLLRRRDQESPSRAIGVRSCPCRSPTGALLALFGAENKARYEAISIVLVLADALVVLTYRPTQRTPTHLLLGPESSRRVRRHHNGETSYNSV